MSDATNKSTAMDLDQLEALTKAATPAPWTWWTSNSTLRLTGADGRDGGVLHATAHRGYGDISCSESDRAFIAAANPVVILELIALARRGINQQDTSRLDWLEEMGNEPDGLLLHGGVGPTGRRGLGLGKIGRSLRQAIDAAKGRQGGGAE